MKQATSNTLPGAGSTNKSREPFQPTITTGNSHVPSKNRGVSRNSPYQFVAHMREKYPPVGRLSLVIQRTNVDILYYVRGRSTHRHEIISSRRSMVNLHIYQVPCSTAWKPLWFDATATKYISKTKGQSLNTVSRAFWPNISAFSQEFRPLVPYVNRSTP